MKNTDYTKDTLRKHSEPEPIHWGYKLIGMVLAMVLLSWVGAWIAERIAK